MAIWKPTPVSEEPVTELFQWNVFEIPALKAEGKERHVVGSTEYDPGRVSSKIIEFDATTNTITTRSGRRYKLVGPSGMNRDAEYVMSRWLYMNRVDDTKVTMVTSQYEVKENL